MGMQTLSNYGAQWERYWSYRFLMGKMQEMGILWCLKAAMIKLLSPMLFRLGVRFVPIYVERIGHLACEPDCYIKEGLLGLRPKYREIVLAPEDKVVNLHLLSYWRRYLRIITSPRICSLLTPLASEEILRFDSARYAVAINDTALIFAIEAKYGLRPPLLALSEEDRERGWSYLRKLGMPEGSWFVGIHCREKGYIHGPEHDFRNSDIHNYLLAMQAIIERGGWCIRVGDPTMKPLPRMERVIDYAHLDIKSEWMDVFLCASSRFFLGGNSGLAAVAAIFGVPCAFTNLAPLSVVYPFGINDIGIPKLIRSSMEKRYLPFKEILDSPIGNFRFTKLYEEAGVRLEENSPEDIRDLVLEMLDITEGKAIYTGEDEDLQQRFRFLIKPGHYSYGAASRVGKNFLRKYSWLLPEEEPSHNAKREAA